MMKKRMAVFMTAAMLMAGSSVYAAEVSQAPQSGTEQQMPPQGGMEQQAPPQGDMNQQPPQDDMNQQAPLQGDMDQQAPQGGTEQQAPPQGDMNQQAPQGGMNGQMPQGKGRGGMHRGGRDGRDHGRISFEDYQKDGTISQETYEAIMNYLKDPKEQRDLLSELLEKGIITQEEYDAMKTAEEAGQTTEQTTGQTTGQTTEQTTEQTTGQDQNTAENQPAA